VARRPEGAGVARRANDAGPRTMMRRFAGHAAMALALILVTAWVATAAARQRMVSGTDAAKTARLQRASIQSSDVPARRGVRETLAALRSRWPVRGPINSGFGTRRPFRSHTGIDIGADHNTPVRVPAAGTVVFAGWRNGYGKTIIIDHGHELRSLYGHLSKVGVRREQKVEQGTVIGSTGSTGAASGPHLHYEVLVNGRPVNPRDRVLMAEDDTAGTLSGQGRSRANEVVASPAPRHRAGLNAAR
jgi:murein DD-endopeptidase MepM/ murein hydrolase activator NlpD